MTNPIFTTDPAPSPVPLEDVVLTDAIVNTTNTYHRNSDSPRPTSTIIYGNQKSGKSVTLNAVCDALNHHYADTPNQLTIFHIDCNPLTTRRDVWFAMLDHFNHPKATTINPETRKYTPYTYLKRLLESELRKLQTKHLIVALDDIHTLEDPRTVLKRLLFLNPHSRPSTEQAKKNTTGIGFIATAQHRDVLPHNLHSVRKYRIDHRSIHPLNRETTQEIIDTFLTTTIHPDALSQETRNHLSRHTHSGVDLGTTISTLLEAGEIAQANGDTQITTDHLAQANPDFIPPTNHRPE